MRLISDEIRTHLGRNICTESSRSHVRTLKTKLIIRDLMDTLEEPYVFLCLLVKTGSERKDRRKKEKKKQQQQRNASDAQSDFLSFETIKLACC